MPTIGGVAILLFAMVAPAFAATSFLPGVEFTVGKAPAHLASGDINGDGVMDLVSADRNAGTVSLLLADGTGGFATPVSVPVGGKPIHVALEDVNRDDLVDLVVADSQGSTLSFLLADGAGSFVSGPPYALQGVPVWLGVADLDNDGWPDVIAVEDRDVEVLLGLGDGLFGPGGSYRVTRKLGVAVLHDLDGDHDLDLAVTNATVGGLSILAGDGQGGLAAAVHLATGPDPRGVVVLDVDDDGLVDLVAANRTSNNVTVLRGLGAGAFDSPVSYPTVTAPEGLVAGDFDGDCIVDIAVADPTTGGRVAILAGDGAGGFLAPEAHALSSSPEGLTATDVDRDLRADLAWFDSSKNSVSVFRNDTVLVCNTYQIRRSTDPATVRTVAPMAEVTGSPFDDTSGILTDDRLFFYVVDHAGGQPAVFSLHRNEVADTVRIGFNDGDPFSAPVDGSVSSVGLTLETIPADGISTTTITVIPRDGNGVALGSGLYVKVDPVALLPGEPHGAVRDETDGSYTLEVSSEHSGLGEVVVSVEGLLLADEPTITFQP